MKGDTASRDENVSSWGVGILLSTVIGSLRSYNSEDCSKDWLSAWRKGCRDEVFSDTEPGVDVHVLWVQQKHGEPIALLGM